MVFAFEEDLHTVVTCRVVIRDPFVAGGVHHTSFGVLMVDKSIAIAFGVLGRVGVGGLKIGREGESFDCPSLWQKRHR